MHYKQCVYVGMLVCVRFCGRPRQCTFVTACVLLCVGLNLMSQFHLDNVTVYNTKSEDYDQARKLVSCALQLGVQQ